MGGDRQIEGRRLITVVTRPSVTKDLEKEIPMPVTQTDQHNTPEVAHEHQTG